MKKSWKIIAFGTIGIVSGVLSSVCMIFMVIGEMMWLPGFVFGILLALGPQKLMKSLSYVKFIGIITISTLSYFVAFWTTLGNGPNWFGLQPGDSFFDKFSPFSLLLGGFVGSIILLTGYRKVIYPLSKLQILCLTLLGSVLSVSFLIPTPSLLNSGTRSFLQFLLLFVLWQTGIAIALAYVTFKKPLKRKK